MRRFLPTALLTLLSVLLAGGLTLLPGTASAARGKKKSASGTTETPKPLSAYEKLFKDKRVTTVRGFMTLHMFEGNKLYVELPDSLLGRGLMITTTIERTGDPGDGLAHQQPVPPYMVEFGRGKSDTLLYMREFAPVVIVDGSPAMREAVGRSNIGPIAASYAVKARTPDKKSSVVDVTALFVGDAKRLRPIDPDGGNTYGGWMTAKADYKKDRSMLTGVTGGKGCVSVVGELSYGTTVSFLGVLDLWKDKPQSIVARRTLRVLGDPERRMRLCDQRLGLAAKAFKRFSDREQEAKTDYYACRRSIVDSAGKVRPVVFYVDTAFDASAYAAVERGHGQQVEQPEQGTRAGKPVRAERVRQCGERKAGRRSGEADGGARKRRRRQAAPQDSAAGGQAQGVHRAAGQPNDKKVSALMYSRRQQENGEHAALIRAPERSHEHKKAVADLNPAHSAR